MSGYTMVSPDAPRLVAPGAEARPASATATPTIDLSQLHIKFVVIKSLAMTPMHLQATIYNYSPQATVGAATLTELVA